MVAVTKKSVIDVISSLRDENQVLRDILASFTSNNNKIFNDLSQAENRVISILIKTLGYVSTNSLYDCIYWDASEDKQPEYEIIKVWVYKVRKKLAPYGIIIETKYRHGYILTEDSRTRFRQLMEEQACDIDIEINELHDRAVEVITQHKTRDEMVGDFLLDLRSKDDRR